MCVCFDIWFSSFQTTFFVVVILTSFIIAVNLVICGNLSIILYALVRIHFFYVNKKLLALIHAFNMQEYSSKIGTLSAERACVRYNFEAEKAENIRNKIPFKYVHFFASFVVLSWYVAAFICGFFTPQKIVRRTMDLIVLLYLLVRCQVCLFYDK